MRKLVAIIMVFGVSLLASIVPASAQQALCMPGTGGQGQPACVACTPGPYNICVPDTGLIEEDGSINTTFLFAIVGLFVAGIALYSNGKYLSKKVASN